MFCAATAGNKDNRLCNHLKVLPLHDNVSFPSLREPCRWASLPPREHSSAPTNLAGLNNRSRRPA